MNLINMDVDQAKSFLQRMYFCLKSVTLISANDDT
jgi:hypothetical protein